MCTICVGFFLFFFARGSVGILREWLYLPMLLHGAHLLFMCVRPAAYTLRVRAIFLVLHAVNSGLLPVVRYRDVPRISECLQQSHSSHAWGGSAAYISFSDSMLHMCQAMGAMLPFKWYLCYTVLRLSVDIRVIIPTLSSLMMTEPDVVSTSIRACRWLRSALSLLAPTPAVQSAQCEVSHVAYVTSALCIIFGHAIPLLAVYHFELTTKLQFLRARGVQHWRLPDRQVQTMVLVMLEISLLMLASLGATAMAATTTLVDWEQQVAAAVQEQGA